MLHFKVKPFIVGARDWTGEVTVAIGSPSCLTVFEASRNDNDDHSDHILEFNQFSLGTLYAFSHDLFVIN